MTTTMAMAGVFALLAGCNRASTPAEVRHDVTEASQDAATRLADAQAVAAKDVRKEGAALDKTVESASTRVADSARHVADAEAEGSYDVAITKAEGEHKVTTEQCKSLAGDAQKACMDRADLSLLQARSNAEASRSLHKL
jgi:hypothetical protein